MKEFKPGDRVSYSHPTAGFKDPEVMYGTVKKISKWNCNLTIVVWVLWDEHKMKEHHLFGYSPEKLEAGEIFHP